MADRIAARIGLQLQHRSLLAAIAAGLDPDHAPEILKQLVTAAMAQGFYSRTGHRLGRRCGAPIRSPMMAMEPDDAVPRRGDAAPGPALTPGGRP